MTDRALLQQVLEALEQSETTVPYEGFGMAHREAERKHQASIAALRERLAQPEQQPFFTEANGFPQTLVPKDRQKQAIRGLTDQCAALVWERDELQKQVWRYEQHGVTCQTYRHKVEQSCSECNVQEKYT